VLHIKNVAHTSGNANSGATNSRNPKSRLSRALWADVEHAKNAASETVVSPVATVTEVAAESTATQSAVENGVAARQPH
ncbi:hypothetical protein QP369_25420, partial [Escherichia coli]|nr:hypothetical protein [Escherichia coli]